MTGPGDLQTVDQLPDPSTGELVPAVPANAARIWLLATEHIRRLDEIRHDCGWVLGQVAEHLGKKTLDVDGKYAVTMRGGRTTVYDPHEVMAGLMECGCPPDRVNAAVVETVTYKINHAVLRQLAGANPDYAAAIDAARQEVEAPWRASVK